MSRFLSFFICLVLPLGNPRCWHLSFLFLCTMVLKTVTFQPKWPEFSVPVQVTPLFRFVLNARLYWRSSRNFVIPGEMLVPEWNEEWVFWILLLCFESLGGCFLDLMVGLHMEKMNWTRKGQVKSYKKKIQIWWNSWIENVIWGTLKIQKLMKKDEKSNEGVTDLEEEDKE